MFVDVTRDTFQIDVDAIEAMIGPRTKAILAPNLIGNAPDWDQIRVIADRHGLRVVEDSCDALGLTLRGTPTGTRADISLTSFALSHIITAAGTGGMVCFDDDELTDRALLLRRWGRRSELQLFGSKRGVERRFFSTIDGDLEYDNLFIFDEVGWNFEPSELSAAFGVVQLDKLAENLARRQRNYEMTRAHLSRWPDVFTLPRTTPGIETGWHMFPTIISPDAGIRRADFQQWMEGNGVDTRMVWTGNVVRQPAFRDKPYRQPPSGLPNADRVMEWGVVLPNNHTMTDDDCAYIGACVDEFMTAARSRLMVPRFAGRRALVTGASRGIGAAIAERLAAEGADVAITARTLDEHDHLPGSLNETRRRLEAYGGNVAVVVADLSDEADRARVVPAAVDALGGPIEILVNNAAAAIYQPLAEFPLRRRRVLFDVNVHAPLDLAQAVIPAMRAAGEGWIVNLSSGAARSSEGPPVRPGAARHDPHGVRGVEGRAEPRDQRPGRRDARQRNTRQHHRTPRRGAE